MRSLAAVLAVFFLVQAASSMTVEQYENTKEFMTEWLKGSKHLPGSVRLGFHDCVGGCNGCLNPDNPDNAGTQQAVRALEVVFKRQGFSEIMSRADFWAISCIAGIEGGIEIANENCTITEPYCETPPLNAVFQWGRVDCDSPVAPDTDEMHEFPNPHMTAAEVFDYFDRTFGLDEGETTALLGAHTLGRARQNESGWEGSWIEHQEKAFNNKFYSIMIDKMTVWDKFDMEKRPDHPNHWQWDGFEKLTGEKAAMMFNTDYAVYYDVTMTETGEPTCDVQPGEETCQRMPTFELAKLYGEDAQRWIDDFRVALTKMISAGSDLQDLME